MIVTKVDERNFKNADKCYICNKKCSEKDVRVGDHCHITGKYRGSAHQDCNKHLLVFLAPNIIFIGQMEKDIGRGVSRVQYLSTADQ